MASGTGGYVIEQRVEQKCRYPVPSCQCVCGQYPGGPYYCFPHISVFCLHPFLPLTILLRMKALFVGNLKAESTDVLLLAVAAFVRALGSLKFDTGPGAGEGWDQLVARLARAGSGCGWHCLLVDYLV